MMIVGSGCAIAGGVAIRAAEIDYARDIRPILASHCFKCHGPDDVHRQASLRLDTREEALKPADSGAAAIVPGKPAESELARRIFAADEDEVMPPPSTKHPLNATQKTLLRAWIAAGAEYQPHWAFLPPRRAPPAASQGDWPRNPIDSFVLARLEAAQLTPSPTADRHTLARRVYLDLIGLPPTPAEADAFVNDPAPDAYERLVDRLLASPRYGERWARRWLDLARYADTNGYEKDRPRSIWPYRDWVIGALNQDMPFSRFTLEQLAGDMLLVEEGKLPAGAFNASDLAAEDFGPLAATGFHRNTMLNEEGGIDPLEFRFYAQIDRVNTTGAAWLGLSLGCAQCHTHKYDPIPQREYYGVMAFLNNFDEPEVEAPTAETQTRRQELARRVAQLESELPDKFPPAPDAGDNGAPADARPLEQRRREHFEAKFQAWLADESARAVAWRTARPAAVSSNLPRLDVLDDGSVFASGDQSKRDVYELTLAAPPIGVTALRLEVLPDERLPKRGPGRIFYEGPHGDFFLSELQLEADGVPTPLKRASHTFANGGHTAAKAIDGDPLTGWSIQGAQGKSNNAVFELAAPLGAVRELKVRMVFERYYAAGLGRFRLALTDHAAPIEARAVPADVEALLAERASQGAAAELATAARARLLEYFVSVAPELASERAAIEKLRAQMPANPTTLVVQERPADNPRPTRLHRRGEFLQPTDTAPPTTLSMLHAFPATAPRNRLAFARWLVDPSNPLVGRVAVNRQWAAFFGKGIVRTQEDFGVQGELPTHPELLDWLALEFVEGVQTAQGEPSPGALAYSLKRLHRLIVTSATYQQDTRLTADRAERDPDNKLLSRGPRARLEAELVRDVALHAAGLLSSKIGGPSVFPPQPAAVTTEGAYGRLDWKVSPGEDRHRRGLYTFAKRTAPFAMLQTFDGPSGEACVPRRESSNTPLQALTLLNDVTFVEAAQALGARAAAGLDAEGGETAGVEAKAAGLFRRVLTRPPTAAERSLLAAYYETQFDRLLQGALSAETLAGVASAKAVETAAWTVAARALLNTDEAVMKN